MNYLNVKEIRLFDADSLEYAGCIKVNGQSWHYDGVKDDYMIGVTSGMPLKAALQCMITFNLVYEIIEE
ncbi:MAG TPA: hypothetical protein PKX79_11570 [Spirochaetota bacterium]|jgi:hypothetical protein|nr:hypothetical protein [Spirochaetota bacterium]OQA96580.1 MAG: hypothetical protein BWY23_01953 [Spirochaetes bacterium ADurb.Bin218]HOK92941.1 hypothetical protein [Spirochaetota bacterium]HOQ12739.1 hypothetical protein [Spirochaetota bacterium]HOV09238.1 hypothetical protein [Spirochaetota bacterium]